MTSLDPTSKPAYDWSRFSWRQSPTNPTFFEREAWAAEMVSDVWHRFSRNDQMIFFGVDLRLSPSRSVPAADFIQAVRAAWAALRFEIPTLAAHTEYTRETNNPLITYRAASDAGEVERWAMRTVRGRNDYHGLEAVRTLDEMRYELAKRASLPEQSGDQTIMYVLDTGSDGEGKNDGTAYGLLLHTLHVPFDAAGVKIVTTRLVTKIAAILDGRVQREAWRTLAWGEEAKNLLPSVSDVLGPNEETGGPTYAETLQDLLGDLVNLFPRSYSFKLRNVGPGPSGRLWRTFSKERTAHILAGCRAHGFTLNQIAHAAVYLVAAKDNPIPADSDGVFVHFGYKNARSSLAAPYDGRTDYPGFCLRVAMVSCPCSVFAESSDEPLLLRVAKQVRVGYMKLKEQPSLLAVSGEAAEAMIYPMKQGLMRSVPAATPCFSGDGIGEDYLQPAYEDTQGNEIIRIKDMFTSLNITTPAVFFRPYTWNGCLTLGVDFNEYATPPDVMQGWLDEWAGHLESLVGTK